MAWGNPLFSGTPNDVVSALNQYFSGPYHATSIVPIHFVNISDVGSRTTLSPEMNGQQAVWDPPPLPNSGESLVSYMSRVFGTSWGAPSGLNQVAQQGVQAVIGLFPGGGIANDAVNAARGASIQANGNDITLTWTNPPNIVDIFDQENAKIDAEVQASLSPPEPPQTHTIKFGPFSTIKHPSGGTFHAPIMSNKTIIGGIVGGALGLTLGPIGIVVGGGLGAWIGSRL